MEAGKHAFERAKHALDSAVAQDVEDDTTEDVVSEEEKHPQLALHSQPVQKAIRQETQAASSGAQPCASERSSIRVAVLSRIDEKLLAFGVTQSVVHRRHTQRMQSVRQWPRWRVCLMAVARARIFKALVSLLILVNTSMLIVLANHPMGSAPAAEAVSNACIPLFALDFGLRALTRTRPSAGWLYLDGLALLASLAELVFDLLVWDGEAQLWAALQVLRLFRLLRFLRVLRRWRAMRAIRLLFRVMHKPDRGGWLNILLISLFVGGAWLLFAILATTLAGRGAAPEAGAPEEEDDEDLREAADHFRTVPRSFLAMLEASTGGLRWGTLVRALLAGDRPVAAVGGLVVLASCLLSVFCLWNLVLGIWVNQVLTLGSQYDKDMEHQVLVHHYTNAKELRLLLEVMDFDHDGYITTAELKAGLQSHPEVVRQLGVSEQSLHTLHSSLTAEQNGNVLISELLFGVLKLRCASKSIDAFSVEYRHKALLRTIATLEKRAEARFLDVDGVLSQALDAAAGLGVKVQALAATVAGASSALARELAVEDQADRRRRGDRRDEEWELGLAENLSLAGLCRREARAQLERRLAGLVRRCEELRRARFPGSGGALAPGAARRAALRRAVRLRLEAELRPWLEERLAAAGVPLAPLGRLR